MPKYSEYFLFAACLLLILLGFRHYLKSRFGVSLGIVWWTVNLAVIGAGGFFIAGAGQDFEKYTEDAQLIMVRTYALELSRMGHEKIKTGTPADDPELKIISDAVAKWEKLNHLVADIYTVRVEADGSRVFVADSPTDYNRDGVFSGERELSVGIGEKFEEYDKGFDIALSGVATFDAEVVEDKWGRWVGAWAPIYDSSGKIDALVGVDYPADEWYGVINMERRMRMAGTSALLALISIGSAAFVVFKRDVERRLMAEARFRDTDERMQLTVRQMPIGFIEWDRDARVIAWNPAAERIFEFARAEVIGNAMFGSIVPATVREHVDGIFGDLLSNRGGTHSINDNLTKSGKSITCEWFNTPLVDSRGKIVGVFSLVQNITERIHLEKHIQNAQRLNAVGQLAAGVAHDFNNILTIITGHTGLLLSRDDIDTEARLDLERVENAAMRAASLTRQLLAFSRQQAMFPRPLCANEVVRASSEMLSRVIGEHIRFNIKLSEPLPTIEADPAMLDQIITNLVINARDAMPRGGVLTISTQLAELTPEMAEENPEAKPGPAVQISVADNGCGIPPENLARIFEPFFTTKEVGKGTGLGLSVVHGVVRQHRGCILVETMVGKGTTFRILIPVCDLPAEPLHTKPTQSIKTTSAPKKTILIVEDEAVVRELAKIILERAGYEVLEAEDGPSALAIWNVEKKRIKMLITDMVMPNGITGRELAQRLFSERPELPVIYASGYSQELTAPGFEETETRVFLQKPYLGDQLVALVKRLIRK